MALLKQLTPVIIADAVEPGIAFWADRFGFKVTNQVPGPDGKLIFASVEKDGIELMYQTRASVIETLQKDYIRTARAKGVSDRRVILRHAWRNSLIPIVTLVGFSIANLVAGSYVIEVVFSWPGMAQFGFEAILKRDYPVIMGVTIVSSLFIIIGNLLADLAYIVVNPQVAAK
jgi:ABC-type dipeptide/oligopeptide/nickel transport system permease component